MKRFIVGLMLALTAVSATVVIANPAAAQHGGKDGEPSVGPHGK